MKPVKSELVGVEIEQFLFKKEFLSQPESGSVDLLFDVDLQVSTQEGKVIVPITISFYDENFKEMGRPWFLKLSAMGIFETEDSIDPAEFGSYALSQLQPHLQQALAALSSQVGIQPINLPDLKAEELSVSVEHMTDDTKN